ncbi:MAG: hypothetical protein QG594_2119 [Bacteroidota bacterium]|nr:hypothetical protein [Bacteroidota bacterium]
MKLKNKIIAAFVLIVGIGAVGYFYVMNGGARDLSTEETTFSVKATDISTEFVSNLEVSNKKYLEKPIEISGKVTEINDSIVTLDKTVLCHLAELNSELKINSQATIKGRVVGYDDLLGELNLDKCLIIK